MKRLIFIFWILLILQSLGYAQDSKNTVSHSYEGQVFYRSALTARARGDSLFKLIHSNIACSQAVIYKVLPGDSLEKIAKKFHTTIELIKKRNSLKEDQLKEGQELSVWDHPFTIIVDKATNRLWLLLNRNIVKQYRVSTGKADTTTPLGEFTIKYRYPFPTWFHRGEIIQGGSEENWLGTRWLGFDKPKYGIHGTIYPQLIGQSVSGGCIRMKNKDVNELYDIVPVGTKVTIIDSRTKFKKSSGGELDY